MPSSSNRILHVTHGDSAAASLRASGVGGDVLSLRDPLIDGPAPALAGPAWREERSRFLAEACGVPYDEALRSYETEDATLSGAGAYQEVVLWFDHELMDQLHLARALTRLADVPDGTSPEERVSLICVGHHPTLGRFIGLGQLDAAQLADLFPSRHALSAEAWAAGRQAWEAYTSPKPAALERLVEEDAPDPPFLAPALRRHLEEYPAKRNGLPGTERRALEALRGGPLTGWELFLAVQERERWLFMGDSSFARRLRELAAGAQPLVRIGRGSRKGSALPAGAIHLTDAGRAVLDGAEDAVALNGFDRWLGGVHLVAAPGQALPWRWDADGGRLAPI